MKTHSFFYSPTIDLKQHKNHSEVFSMNFYEYIIKRKKSTGEKLISVLIYFVAAILAALVLMLLIKLSSIAALLAFGFFYFAYKISTGMNKEFEYILTQDNIAIDVIMNSARRKRLISFSVPDVEIIAPVENKDFASYLNKKYDKIIDATSRSKNTTVYFAVVNLEKRTLVKFEPPYTMLSELFKYAPSKIKISE